MVYIILAKQARVVIMAASINTKIDNCFKVVNFMFIMAIMFCIDS